MRQGRLPCWIFRINERAKHIKCVNEVLMQFIFSIASICAKNSEVYYNQEKLHLTFIVERLFIVSFFFIHSMKCACLVNVCAHEMENVVSWYGAHHERAGNRKSRRHRRRHSGIYNDFMRLHFGCQRRRCDIFMLCEYKLTIVRYWVC